MEKESCVIYRSFYEAAMKIRKKSERLEFLEAMLEFAFDLKERELRGNAEFAFCLIKPQLSANYKKYENGKKRKQNGSKTEANDKQTISKTEANVNVNVNVNENDDVNGFAKANGKSSSSFLLPISECRKKYDSSMKEALVTLANKSNITISRINLFQDYYDNWLVSSSNGQKKYEDYIDHFAKWMGKLSDERKREIYQKALPKNTEQSIIEKYS